MRVVLHIQIDGNMIKDGKTYIKVSPGTKALRSTSNSYKFTKHYTNDGDDIDNVYSGCMSITATEGLPSTVKAIFWWQFSDAGAVTHNGDWYWFRARDAVGEIFGFGNCEMQIVRDGFMTSNSCPDIMSINGGILTGLKDTAPSRIQNIE